LLKVALKHQKSNQINQKTTDWATRTSLRSRVNSGALEG
jgi:hypothetical protein